MSSALTASRMLARFVSTREPPITISVVRARETSARACPWATGARIGVECGWVGWGWRGVKEGSGWRQGLRTACMCHKHTCKERCRRAQPDFSCARCIRMQAHVCTRPPSPPIHPPTHPPKRARCRAARTVEDHVGLLKLEHDVELAHVAEVLVQRLYERVHKLKHGQLILVAVYAHQEEERRVSTVHHLCRVRPVHARAGQRADSNARRRRACSRGTRRPCAARGRTLYPRCSTKEQLPSGRARQRRTISDSSTRRSVAGRSS